MSRYKYGYAVNKTKVSNAPAYHPLADAFINTYELTSALHKLYINTWALGLKGMLPGINETTDFTTKLAFLLPIVPKDIATIRGDLLTATSRPLPTGGWELTAQGFKSNGGNTDWNLGLNLSIFSDEKYGIGFYNTLDLSTHAAVQNYVLGAYAGGKLTGIALNYNNVDITYYGISDDVIFSLPDTDCLGARFSCRPDATKLRVGVNGVATEHNVGSAGANPNANLNAGGLPAYNIYGIVRYGSIYCANQPLTLVEIQKLQTLDNHCQTILGRNVY